MRMHSFDLVGKQAHFRKYYANNTALSFTLPPRTTMMGIVAAILGRPRDSYYRELAPENLKFGIGLLSPAKKSFHRLNLLKILGDSDFRGQKGRIQTPFELVMPIHPRKEDLIYRIYLAGDQDQLMDEIANQLKVRSNSYNLSLGVANFNAALRNTRLDMKVEERKELEEYISLSSAVLSDDVAALKLDKDKKIRIEEDLTPAAFIDDFDRELAAMHRIVYTTDGSKLCARLKVPHYRIDNAQTQEAFVLLD
ncbi:MAG: CRISPR-associated protein Cas5 [Saprospiraceae bacterium]|nr:CRISPR-associated protein Cas5 [Lewinella sp.]